MHISERPGTPCTLEFCAGENAQYREHAIRWFLEQQPASWERMAHSVDDLLDMIYNGVYHVALLQDGKNYKALALYSLRYDIDGTCAMLDFLTCKDFYRTIPFYCMLEQLFRDLGCCRVSAMAHPTIAKYLLKKQNFTTPGILVTKPLEAQLRN